MAPTWIVPFKGRNHSGAFNQNFLWNDGPVYVMDNHRAALWCWLQSLDLSQAHSMFHIDRHTDTLQSRLSTWLQYLPQSWSLGIEQYLAHEYVADKEKFPLFQWDNYLSIYFATFGQAIRRCHFCTHDDGDEPNHPHQKNSIWDIPGNLSFWLNDNDAPWIVNVDLDYFFCEYENDVDIWTSEKYLKDLCQTLKSKLESGRIKALTICLTPDDQYTGGWQKSEALAEKICGYIGYNFRLPAE